MHLLLLSLLHKRTPRSVHLLGWVGVPSAGKIPSFFLVFFGHCYGRLCLFWLACFCTLARPPAPLENSFVPLHFFSQYLSFYLGAQLTLGNQRSRHRLAERKKERIPRACHLGTHTTRPHQGAIRKKNARADTRAAEDTRARDVGAAC
nr:hypothetical protein [Pandoravirus aubagnensis]